jgi:hypothetical protein
MSDSNDPWYRIGYALELAKQRLPAVREGSEAARRGRKSSPRKRNEDWVEQILAVGTGAVASKILGGLPGRKKPGTLRLARAAVAGAGAAAVLALFRSYIAPKDGDSADPMREILAGAGRGIVYGSVLEPHLVGPSAMRGAMFAALEYAISPWGGLDGVLGAASPNRTIPILGALLGTDALEAESITEHLVFGSTLGILYGVAKDRSGSVDAE